MRKQNTENHKKDKKAMKKLLKKMAYDREKYEKQDKSTSDVRKTWRYVFVQIQYCFYYHTRERVSYVSVVVGLSTHFLGLGTTYKLKASIRVTVLLKISINGCSGVGDSACELLKGNKGKEQDQNVSTHTHPPTHTQRALWTLQLPTECVISTE